MKSLKYGGFALDFLFDNYCFENVLDIGSGGGQHVNKFLENKKQVTAIDLRVSSVLKAMACENKGNLKIIEGDFNYFQIASTSYDCIWCCHVLEHQLNVNFFLKKIFYILKDNGICCITVPPLKSTIVGGHVSLWNAGLLLYNLILAGFDCSDCIVMKYGYNISIIVRKKEAILPLDLNYDRGDLRKLKNFFPKCITFNEGKNDIVFDGDIL